MDMNALPKTNYIKTIVTAEAKLDLARKGVQSYQRDIYARFLCFGNGALTCLLYTSMPWRSGSMPYISPTCRTVMADLTV